ncbi:MAG: glycine cleavage T C-terminal barrel domain-containing protein [Thiolinea sp.]
MRPVVSRFSWQTAHRWGQVSSGAYGHSVGASLALGYIRNQYLDGNREFDVAILGKPHRAVLLDEPLFDAAGERLRG